jgi:hypothetical protein
MGIIVMIIGIGLCFVDLFPVLKSGDSHDDEKTCRANGRTYVMDKCVSNWTMFGFVVLGLAAIVIAFGGLYIAWH